MSELPRLLRFSDLKEANIVTSWPQLARLIEKRGFPRGIHLGVNTRAWPEHEIVAWLEERGMSTRRKDVVPDHHEAASAA